MESKPTTFTACGRTYRVHPASAAFPLLEGDELRALVADVRQHGLLEAVTVDGDELLDGRNRLRACDLAGVAPRFAGWRQGGASKTDWIVSLNLRRRHLSASQRGFLAVDLFPIYEAEAAEAKARAAVESNKKRAEPQTSLPVTQIVEEPRNERTAEARAGAAAGVNRQYVHDAKVVAAASPALAAEVRAGTLTLPQAKAQVRREEKQEAVRTASREPTELTGALGRFPVIYADPPWRYEHAVSPTREIENQYPTMELGDIERMPVGDISTAAAVLFLWAPAPKLEEAMGVLRAWGFKYRTNLVWVKDQIGMGYYTRSRHELLLVGVRGDLPVPEPATRPDSVIEAPRGKHSAKPEDVYGLIERMYPDLQRVELFARSSGRPGWRMWGDQAPAQ